MNKAEKEGLEARRGKFTAENEQRVTQVQQWNQHIVELQQAIRTNKEAYDYTRGQINVLNDLLGEEDSAKPQATMPGDSKPETET